MNHLEEFDNSLSTKLEQRKTEGLLRSLVQVTDKIDFSSNDYLGFAQLKELNSYEKDDLRSGATGSRLITGNSALAEQTEKIIAAFHKSEAALIFNSGYMANVGLFSCLAGKGDSYIADEYIHASAIDGMRLSHAARFKFKHNDITDLEKKLIQAQGKKIVAIESVYSMDGDEAPLVEIVRICKKHNALVIVDEAHSTGIYGTNGEGLVCKYGLRNEVYACLHTFGKALGLHGAAITGSQVLRDYLINYSRAFIYATALPPQTYLHIQQAYKLLPGANRKKLFDLIKYFREQRQKFPALSFIDSSSPIQGLTIGENHKAKKLSDYLIDNGHFVKAILSPTVPVGSERLRVCIHTFNSESQIDDFLNQVNTFSE